jgi:hypothetical protein
MLSSKLLVLFLLNLIISIISADEFYTRTDLSKIKNTQIASAAVCPKCLKMTSDGSVGFYDCENNIEQKFRIDLENENFGVFGTVKSLKYKSKLLPSYNNISNLEATYNLLEIFPVDDDGGHSIQLIGTRLCLYHDYDLSNTSTSNHYTAFKTCDYQNKYFKFYFFKTLYTFPEYKVVGSIYVYTLKTSRTKSTLSVLKISSYIRFIDASTNKEEKSITYKPNDSSFNVQLREGNWIVKVELSNEMYYYKPDPYYYFPIKKCHESKDYWLELPIRKSYFNGKNTSGGSKRIVFKIKAKFNIYIKKVYNALSYTRGCGSYMSYGWGTNPVENIKLTQNSCIAIVGYIPFADTSDRASPNDAKAVMDWVATEYDSITVYNGCELSSSYNVVSHTDNYFFYSKTWWDCVNGVSPGIELWDDRTIYDSWDTKY